MNRSNPLPLALAGMAAGLVASAAVIAFETGWGRSHPRPVARRTVLMPPTEVLANELSTAVGHRRLSSADRWWAGQAVHYVTGTVMGLVYAGVARRAPVIETGRGAAFGLGVWAGFEEVTMALLGLRPPPWRVPLVAHGLAAASHVIFGVTLDTVLRQLRPPRS